MSALHLLIINFVLLLSSISAFPTHQLQQRDLITGHIKFIADHEEFRRNFTDIYITRSAQGGYRITADKTRAQLFLIRQRDGLEMNIMSLNPVTESESLFGIASEPPSEEDYYNFFSDLLNGIFVDTAETPRGAEPEIVGNSHNTFYAKRKDDTLNWPSESAIWTYNTTSNALLPIWLGAGRYERVVRPQIYARYDWGQQVFILSAALPDFLEHPIGKKFSGKNIYTGRLAFSPL